MESSSDGERFIMEEKPMAVYLETNALRKLTDYTCEQEHVYTSVFSVFELLSGATEKDFKVRKACLERIKKHKLEIRGPMIDKLFAKLIDHDEYNPFAYKRIMGIFRATLPKKYSFDSYKNLPKRGMNDKPDSKPALTWLKDWDDNIASIAPNVGPVFEDETSDYIKLIYNKDGVKGLAKHFWDKIYYGRIDDKRLSHLIPFVGNDEVQKFRDKIEMLFSKYNYKLFMTAQAVIFAKAYFINGNTQDRNNPSDLLHLLYLCEGDKFVSNDKIYHTISEACPEFNYIHLNEEKALSELI